MSGQIDPESYADGSVATGRVFHAKQAKSEGNKQKVISWPSKLRVEQDG
jgi:hypothetical protein